MSEKESFEFLSFICLCPKSKYVMLKRHSPERTGPPAETFPGTGIGSGSTVSGCLLFSEKRYKTEKIAEPEKKEGFTVKYTPSEASKLIRTLKEKHEALERRERQTREFTAAI